MTTSSSTSRRSAGAPSPSVVRTASTMRPTVASSSSAGSTTLTRVAPLSCEQPVERPLVGGGRARGEPGRDVVLHLSRLLPRPRSVPAGSSQDPDLRRPEGRDSRTVSRTRQVRGHPLRPTPRPSEIVRVRHNRTVRSSRGAEGYGPVKPRQPSPTSRAQQSHAAREADGEKVPTPSEDHPVTRKDEEKASLCRRLTSPPAPPAPIPTPRRRPRTSGPPTGSSAASAARPTTSVRRYACIECFGPLEVGYDFSARDPRAHRGRSAEHVALLRPAARRALRRHASATSNPGLTQLVRADNLAKALGMTGTLWVKDDSGNPTHSFKDRVVAVAQSAARPSRPRHDRVRVDRQPRERRRRRRRPRRDGLGRRHPERPRGRQGPHDRGLRRHAARRRRQLRRREPALLGARSATRSPPTGASSTSTCGRTTPRARRRSATRSPSSSAGACPSRSSRRSRPGRCSPRSTRRSVSSSRSASSRTRRTGCSARRPPAARRCRRRSGPATTSCAR